MYLKKVRDARRSDLPAIRILCTLFIELTHAIKVLVGAAIPWPPR